MNFGEFGAERDAVIRDERDNLNLRMVKLGFDGPGQIAFLREHFPDDVAHPAYARLKTTWVGAELTNDKDAPITVTEEWLRNHVRGRVVETNSSIMTLLRNGRSTKPKATVSAARSRIAYA